MARFMRYFQMTRPGGVGSYRITTDAVSAAFSESATLILFRAALVHNSKGNVCSSPTDVKPPILNPNPFLACTFKGSRQLSIGLTENLA